MGTDNNSEWLDDLRRRTPSAIEKLRQMCEAKARAYIESRRPDLLETLSYCIEQGVQQTLEAVDRIGQHVKNSKQPFTIDNIEAYVEARVISECQMHLLRERDDQIATNILNMAAKTSFFIRKNSDRPFAEAEENAQDTVLKLLIAADAYKRIESLEAYVSGVAYKTYMDKLRGDRGMTGYLPDDEPRGPDLIIGSTNDPEFSPECLAVLQEGIELIISKQRTAEHGERTRNLIKYRLDTNLSSVQVAEALGMSKSNVNTSWHRFREKLVAFLIERGCDPRRSDHDESSLDGQE